jgi:uncharacterized coiled-coil DUF342 family protein
MDWIQALTIIGVFAAFFIYLMNRIDTKFDHVDAKFDGKINQLRSEMHAQNAELRKEIHNQVSELRNEMRDGFNALQQYILLGKIDKKLKDSSESTSTKKEN